MCVFIVMCECFSRHVYLCINLFICGIIPYKRIYESNKFCFLYSSRCYNFPLVFVFSAVYFVFSIVLISPSPHQLDTVKGFRLFRTSRDHLRASLMVSGKESAC